MSNEEIITDFIENIKPILKEKLLELLSQLKDNAPNLLACIKETLTETKKIDLTLENEVNRFKNSNNRFFDPKLKKREDIYYKHSRIVHLLDLYTEYMESDTIYIPRKFRSDKYHVTSTAEMNVLHTRDLKKFQTESEILRIRRDDFERRIFDIDEEVLMFINNSDLSDGAKRWISNRWQECINEDIRRINKKWNIKMISTRKANDKDRKEYNENKQECIKRIEKRSTFIKTSNKDANNLTEIKINKSTTSPTKDKHSTIIHSDDQSKILPTKDKRSTANHSDDQSKNTSGQKHRFDLRSSTSQE